MPLGKTPSSHIFDTSKTKSHKKAEKEPPKHHYLYRVQHLRGLHHGRSDGPPKTSENERERRRPPSPYPVSSGLRGTSRDGIRMDTGKGKSTTVRISSAGRSPPASRNPPASPSASSEKSSPSGGAMHYYYPDELSPKDTSSDPDPLCGYDCIPANDASSHETLPHSPNGGIEHGVGPSRADDDNSSSSSSGSGGMVKRLIGKLRGGYTSSIKDPEETSEPGSPFFNVDGTSEEQEDGKQQQQQQQQQRPPRRQRPAIPRRRITSPEPDHPKSARTVTFRSVRWTADAPRRRSFDTSPWAAWGAYVYASPHEQRRLAREEEEHQHQLQPQQHVRDHQQQPQQQQHQQPYYYMQPRNAIFDERVVPARAYSSHEADNKNATSTSTSTSTSTAAANNESDADIVELLVMPAHHYGSTQWVRKSTLDPAAWAGALAEWEREKARRGEAGRVFRLF